MKVLLTHGYFLQEDLKEQEIMRPYVPLGILYISAYLEENKIDHQVFDTTFSQRSEFKAYLLKEKPDVVAFYTNLMTKISVLELIRFIKTRPELQHTTVVQGGPDITYNVEDYLNAGGDFLVIGEGEQTMLELIHALEQKAPSFTEVQGLAFKDEQGQVIRTATRQKIKAIDELPFPNRKKIVMENYLQVWKEHHGQSSVSVSTQRGCPYTCQWCSTAVYGQSYRRRAPGKVIEELEHINECYAPDSFWFVDDVFTVSHKWLEEFAGLIREKKLKIRFECISRADRMNEQVLQWLKEAGCFRIWIGAESGSQKVIDAMDRRVDVEYVQSMIRLAREYGIEAGTFIMLGYPGETAEDIEKTIRHLKNSAPDLFTITIAYPIKGTGLYNEVEAIQEKSLPWHESTDRDIDFKRTYSRRFYDYAVKHVVNEVNFHKKQMMNQHLSLSGLQLFLKSRLAKTAMKWEQLMN